MAGLVDHRGRPYARRRDLSKEIGRPRAGSVRPALPRNLIRGLDPHDLARIFCDAESGNPDTMLELAATLEKRWPHYRSQIGTRKLAQLGLPRTVIAPTDDARDVEIAEALLAVFESREATEGLTSMTDALGKGYSATEIIWNLRKTPWAPTRFRWRNPQHFVFERTHYEELRLKTEAEPSNGEELEPGKWIVHCPRLVMGLPIQGSLAWVCASSYMLASMALRDWARFVELYGLPLRWAQVEEGASQETIDEVLDSLVALGHESAAVFRGNQAPHFVDAQTPGTTPVFGRMLDWLNRQVSKVIVGQTSSSEGGTSLAHASQQEKVRNDILEADALALAASWTEVVNQAYVVFNYGQGIEYPKSVLITEEPENLELFSKALSPFIKLGLRVEASQVRDRFRLAEPADDAEVIGEGVSDDEARGAAEQLTADARRGSTTAARALVRAGLAGARRAGRRQLANSIEARIHGGRLAMHARRHGFRQHGRVLVARSSRRSRSYPARPRSGGGCPVHGPALAAEGADVDVLDDLTDGAVAEWRDVMQPILDVVVAEAEAAEGAEDFRQRLDEALAPADFELLIQAQGTLGHIAQGIGDVTDRPDGEIDEGDNEDDDADARTRPRTVRTRERC